MMTPTSASVENSEFKYPELSPRVDVSRASAAVAAANPLSAQIPTAARTGKPTIWNECRGNFRHGAQVLDAKLFMSPSVN